MTFGCDIFIGGITKLKCGMQIIFKFDTFAVVYEQDTQITPDIVIAERIDIIKECQIAYYEERDSSRVAERGAYSRRHRSVDAESSGVALKMNAGWHIEVIP